MYLMNFVHNNNFWKLRKLNLKFCICSGMWILGVCEWYGECISEEVEISRNFWKFSEILINYCPVKCMVIRKRKIEIVKLQNNMHLDEKHNLYIIDQKVSHMITWYRRTGGVQSPVDPFIIPFSEFYHLCIS